MSKYRKALLSIKDAIKQNPEVFNDTLYIKDSGCYIPILDFINLTLSTRQYHSQCCLEKPAVQFENIIYCAGCYIKETLNERTNNRTN